MTDADGSGASNPPLPPDYTGPAGYAVLPAGTRVDAYVIERALAAGGFGITYLARHETLDRLVVLKEHFPRQMASREYGSLTVRAHDPAMFQWARERFIEEARALVRCRHPSIVEAIDVREANGTAYMVLSFEDGVSFERWLTRLDRTPTQAELDAILAPLLDALAFVHGQGLIHRDIAPDNIMIRTDGKPCLIDFGAARQAIGLMSGSVTAIVKPGYSPVEQYVSEAADQDAWTDIYAMGATLYRAVIGKRPMEATARIPRDRLVSAATAAREPASWRPGFLAAIDAALAIDHEARPRTVTDWRGMLLGADAKWASEAPNKSHAKAVTEPPPLPTTNPIDGLRVQSLKPPMGLALPLGPAAAPNAEAPPNPRAVTYSQLPADGGRRPAPGQPRRRASVKAVTAAVIALALGGAGWWMIEQRVPPAADPAVTKAPAPPKPGASTQEVEAAAAWATVRDSTNTGELEAFVARFGRTFHGELARLRLAELLHAAKKQQDEKARQDAAEAARKKAEADARRRDPILALVPGSGQSARDPLADGRACPDCPEMVVVPKGAFRMGSPNGEADRGSNEGPVRTVTFREPFAVGKHEVTFDEWDACVRESGCTHKPGDEGWGRGRRPVINVSWNDAGAYAAWLSANTGKGYRLLSEAEWEYAARAGTTTPFSTGPTITTDQANFDGNYTYGGSSKGQYRQKTVDVGSFRPNAWGLHDMHGNIWEWVQDCWIDNYRDAPMDGRARTTGDCNSRVLRGGSWLIGPQYLRSALRDRYQPDNRGISSGFRVARSVSR